MRRRTPSGADVTFMLVVLDDKGRIDAAAHFMAPPEIALKVAKPRARAGGYKKFQVYRLELGEGLELKVTAVN